MACTCTTKWRQVGELPFAGIRSKLQTLLSRIPSRVHDSTKPVNYACASRTPLLTVRPIPCDRYQGGRKYADFLKFLEDQLEADKGFARSPAMDKLASSFLAASSEDKAGVIAEVCACRVAPNCIFHIFSGMVLTMLSHELTGFKLLIVWAIMVPRGSEDYGVLAIFTWP